MSASAEFLLNDPLLPRERHGGVGRYVRRLAEGLAADWGERMIIYSSEALAAGTRARRIHSKPRRGGRLIPWHDLRLPRLASRFGVRAVFSPYFGRVPAGVPEVFTVHDLTYFTYPQRRSWKGLMEEMVRREQVACFQRGAALIAVSEATRQDLLGRFPAIPPERVVVVHHGVDPVFLEPMEAPIAASNRPVFLFVGRRAGYKNFNLLLEAWRIAGLGRTAELRVTAAPSDSWSADEQEGLRRAGLGDAARLVHVPDDTALRAEYAAASALVYPSAREGFGLPVLEAMAAGTLIICSHATSLPEVGGPVPLYHDPADAEELAERLREVLALAPAGRAEKVLAGRRRAETFSWGAAFARTREILEAVAERRPWSPLQDPAQ